MAVETPITLDRQRILELIQREEQELNARTPASGGDVRRARNRC